MRRTKSDELLASLLGKVVSPADMKAFFALRLGRSWTKQHIDFAFLDAEGRLLGVERMFTWVADEVSIQFRAAIKAALSCDARHLVVAHNNCDKDAIPIGSDIDLFKNLSKVFSIIEIVVVDYLIVGSGKVEDVTSLFDDMESIWDLFADAFADAFDDEDEDDDDDDENAANVDEAQGIIRSVIPSSLSKH